MYTADAVDEELDAMARNPVDPAEREVLQEELRVMTQLLQKLTELEARRRSYMHGRSRRSNARNASASGARQTSSSNPPAPSV